MQKGKHGVSGQSYLRSSIKKGGTFLRELSAGEVDRGVERREKMSF